MSNPFRTNRRSIRILAVVFVALLLAPLAASAQSGTPVVVMSEEMPRTITVTGVGTVEVAPDTASLSFGVYEQSESLETAQDAVTTRLEGIMAALTEQGVAEEDIQTTGYNVTVVNEYDRDGNLVGVIGYEVRSSITVTVRDIESVGSLLDSVVTAGANEVGSVSFYVEDTEAAANQARIAAIEDARAKADTMATASGVTIAGVYAIEEMSSPQPLPIAYEQSLSDASGSEEMARAVPVSPGQAEIRVEIRVVYEIDQPLG